MSIMSSLGRSILTVGFILVAIGLFMMTVGRYVPIGRLPGDVMIRRGNVTFYFPLVTSLLLSLMLSLLLRLLRR